MGGIVNLFNSAGFFGHDSLAKPSLTDEQRKINGYVRQIRGELPPIESLPKPLRDFIHDVKGLPDAERVAMIHTFVNSTMKYDEQEEKEDIRLGRVSMNYGEVIRGFTKGDCDNHATLEIALLRYTGTKPEDITWLTGRFSYTTQDGKEKLNGMHHTAILRQGGAFYLLDMNLERPVPLNNKLKMDGPLSPELTQGWVQELFGAGVAGFLGLKNDSAGKVEIKPVMLIPLAGDLQAYDFKESILGGRSGGLIGRMTGPTGFVPNIVKQP